MYGYFSLYAMCIITAAITAAVAARNFAAVAKENLIHLAAKKTGLFELCLLGEQ